MDCSKPKIRKQNPRERANICSILFFKYTLDVLYTGLRKDLKIDDIYKVLKTYRANNLYHRMSKEWEKEKKKSNPSIFLIFLRMFYVEFIVWGVGLYGLLYCYGILQPILTGKLMSYFEAGSNVTLQDAFLYATARVGSAVLVTILDNTYLLAVWLIGLKMQIACCTLIYRKCLKLDDGSKGENNNGKVITLITKDVLQLITVVDCGHMLVLGFPKFLIMVYIMYTYIGVSALVSAAIVFFMIPVNVYLGKLAKDYRLKTAKHTDARVKVTQEIITAIRVVKMYTWERFFAKKIDKLRKQEIRDLRILLYLKAIALSVGQLSSRFAFYACVMSYIALGNHVTAEKAFVAVGYFDAITTILTDHMPKGIAQMAEYKASLRRITNFLMSKEVSQNQTNNTCNNEKPIGIHVNNVTVKKQNGAVVLDNINLNVSKGLTVVMGSTGTGKSVLLKLILGDVPVTSGEVNVNGELSYASQEPWLFPATVRQNIIFGENFDEKRYSKVIEVCALEWDFKMFPYRDETYITDSGLNLSKGQKARINLARAIYRKADIYLLDECLSSVDNLVCQHIFFKCIKEFLKDSICILITHNTLPLDVSDNLLILSNGNLRFSDSLNSVKELETNESVITYRLKKLQNASEKQSDNGYISSQDEGSALLEKQDSVVPNLYEEFNQTGKVNKHVYYQYFLCGGGYKTFLIVAIFSIAAYVATSWSEYFVSFWVDMEQELSGYRLNQTVNSTEYKELEQSHDSVMKSYSFVMLGAAIFTIARSLTFFIFTSKASTHIHNAVIARIIGTGIIFFDKNLSGNILNRFSRDLGIVDESLPLILFECSGALLSIIATLFIVSSVNWFFIIPSIIFVILLYFARHFYMPTGRNLKRLEGAARSPLIGHVNATLEGLTTIRASKVENTLQKEFDEHQDLYTSAFHMNLATARAFNFYTDLLGAIYTTIIIFSFLLFKTDTLAGKIGLAITQSFSLNGILKWGMLQWAELENQMTSTERVLDYNSVDLESSLGNKIDNWPHNGSIEFRNVNLKYSTGNERVLKDLNFYVKSKETVGIVGRTGAGKTSIISTLFRMYDYEGVILIDGIDIKSVPTNYLRSKLSIIPQDPVLFSGTVRSNLDPYFEYSDDILWEALKEVEMANLFTSLEENIVGNNDDFSVGQKQLMCLARALVRNSNILVLDEVTASLDLATDNLIQNILNKRFCNCTVITIAHRLATVMKSDNIIVMDAAKIVQYGPPEVLLEDKNGLFYNMVKSSDF